MHRRSGNKICFWKTFHLLFSFQSILDLLWLYRRFVPNNKEFFFSCLLLLHIMFASFLAKNLRIELKTEIDTCFGAIFKDFQNQVFS